MLVHSLPMKSRKVQLVMQHILLPYMPARHNSSTSDHVFMTFKHQFLNDWLKKKKMFHSIPVNKAPASSAWVSFNLFHNNHNQCIWASTL